MRSHSLELTDKLSKRHSKQQHLKFLQEKTKSAFSHIQNLQVSVQNTSTVPKTNTRILSTATYCLNTSQLIPC